MASKFKMTDEELLEYINQCFTEADDVFQTDIKPVTDECWNLFRCYRDYSDKDDWQTKHVNPRAFVTVETGVSLVKRSLVSIKDFFSVKGQEHSDREREELVKEAVRFYLRRAKFFVKFIEALTMAFIGGLGWLKIYWKRWEEEIMGV